MKIDAHFDERADIAWLRFEGYDSATVVAEETVRGQPYTAAHDRRGVVRVMSGWEHFIQPPKLRRATD